MEMTSFLLILFFFLLIYSFFFLFNPTNSKSTPQSGFKHYPIFGTLPEFLLNRHRFLDWSTQVLSQCPTNTAVFSRPGKVNGVITANPTNIEHMLKTNFENYPKGIREYIARVYYYITTIAKNFFLIRYPLYTIYS
ncbi:hypothetical protein HanXRQr2_Chr06g0262871 [Helianthus annuus]|uniref:Cytochrome P450 n=1 Tax=Helianthus annuus TaxID=4232 RepID=A0A9K3IV84_HELAN|nr:hypothetical protein HanXRQr2_Chr06g0262871 [Helianthus annuus]KAJ0915752.1 hypothetical protein HanPSC8_Chr06g0253531 [Helianthus annuus]